MPITEDGGATSDPRGPIVPLVPPSIPASHPLDSPNRKQEFGEGARVIHPREPGT